LASSSNDGDGTHQWRLIGHPHAQVRLESIALIAMYPSMWAAWLIGVDWLIVACTSVLLWSTLRMLNRRNYGVWVRAGEIDLRGPLSKRPIPAKAITRLVVDGPLAKVRVFDGKARMSNFVGIKGWPVESREEVLDRLAIWAEQEDLRPPELWQSATAIGILGWARGAVRYPRRPNRLRRYSLTFATALMVAHVLVGMWLQATVVV
jgi:hypothetical protein